MIVIFNEAGKTLNGLLKEKEKNMFVKYNFSAPI